MARNESLDELRAKLFPDISLESYEQLNSDKITILDTMNNTLRKDSLDSDGSNGGRIDVIENIKITSNTGLEPFHQRLHSLVQKTTSVKKSLENILTEIHQLLSIDECNSVEINQNKGSIKHVEESKQLKIVHDEAKSILAGAKNSEATKELYVSKTRNLNSNVTGDDGKETLKKKVYDIGDKYAFKHRAERESMLASKKDSEAIKESYCNQGSKNSDLPAEEYEEPTKQTFKTKYDTREKNIFEQTAERKAMLANQKNSEAVKESYGNPVSNSDANVPAEDDKDPKTMTLKQECHGGFKNAFENREERKSRLASMKDSEAMEESYRNQVSNSNADVPGEDDLGPRKQTLKQEYHVSVKNAFENRAERKSMSEIMKHSEAMKESYRNQMSNSDANVPAEDDKDPRKQTVMQEYCIAVKKALENRAEKKSMVASKKDSEAMEESYGNQVSNSNADVPAEDDKDPRKQTLKQESHQGVKNAFENRAKSKSMLASMNVCEAMEECYRNQVSNSNADVPAEDDKDPRKQTLKQEYHVGVKNAFENRAESKSMLASMSVSEAIEESYRNQVSNSNADAPAEDDKDPRKQTLKEECHEGVKNAFENREERKSRLASMKDSEAMEESYRNQVSNSNADVPAEDDKDPKKQTLKQEYHVSVKNAFENRAERKSMSEIMKHSEAMKESYRNQMSNSDANVPAEDDKDPRKQTVMQEYCIAVKKAFENRAEKKSMLTSMKDSEAMEESYRIQVSNSNADVPAEDDKYPKKQTLKQEYHVGVKNAFENRAESKSMLASMNVSEAMEESYRNQVTNSNADVPAEDDLGPRKQTLKQESHVGAKNALESRAERKSMIASTKDSESIEECYRNQVENSIADVPAEDDKVPRKQTLMQEYCIAVKKALETIAEKKSMVASKKDSEAMEESYGNQVSNSNADVPAEDDKDPRKQTLKQEYHVGVKNAFENRAESKSMLASMSVSEAIEESYRNQVSNSNADAPAEDDKDPRKQTLKEECHEGVKNAFENREERKSRLASMKDSEAMEESYRNQVSNSNADVPAEDDKDPKKQTLKQECHDGVKNPFENREERKSRLASMKDSEAMEESYRNQVSNSIADDPAEDDKDPRKQTLKQECHDGVKNAFENRAERKSMSEIMKHSEAMKESYRNQVSNSDANVPAEDNKDPRKQTRMQEYYIGVKNAFENRAEKNSMLTSMKDSEAMEESYRNQVSNTNADVPAEDDKYPKKQTLKQEYHVGVKNAFENRAESKSMLASMNVSEAMEESYRNQVSNSNADVPAEDDLGPRKQTLKQESHVGAKNAFESRAERKSMIASTKDSESIEECYRNQVENSIADVPAEDDKDPRKQTLMQEYYIAVKKALETIAERKSMLASMNVSKAMEESYRNQVSNSNADVPAEDDKDPKKQTLKQECHDGVKNPFENREERKSRLASMKDSEAMEESYKNQVNNSNADAPAEDDKDPRKRTLKEECHEGVKNAFENREERKSRLASMKDSEAMEESYRNQVSYSNADVPAEDDKDPKKLTLKQECHDGVKNPFENREERKSMLASMNVSKAMEESYRNQVSNSNADVPAEDDKDPKKQTLKQVCHDGVKNPFENREERKSRLASMKDSEAMEESYRNQVNNSNADVSAEDDKEPRKQEFEQENYSGVKSAFAIGAESNTSLAARMYDAAIKGLCGHQVGNLKSTVPAEYAEVPKKQTLKLEYNFGENKACVNWAERKAVLVSTEDSKAIQESYRNQFSSLNSIVPAEDDKRPKKLTFKKKEYDASDKNAFEHRAERKDMLGSKKDCDEIEVMCEQQVYDSNSDVPAEDEQEPKKREVREENDVGEKKEVECSHGDEYVDCVENDKINVRSSDTEGKELGAENASNFKVDGRKSDLTNADTFHDSRPAPAHRSPQEKETFRTGLFSTLRKGGVMFSFLNPFLSSNEMYSDPTGASGIQVDTPHKCQKEKCAFDDTPMMSNLTIFGSPNESLPQDLSNIAEPEEKERPLQKHCNYLKRQLGNNNSGPKKTQISSKQTMKVMSQIDNSGKVSHTKSVAADNTWVLDTIHPAIDHEQTVNAMMSITEIIECNETKVSFVRNLFCKMSCRCSLNSILLKILSTQPSLKVLMDCESDTIKRIKGQFTDYDGKPMKGGERRVLADMDEKTIYLGGLVNEKCPEEQLMGIFASALGLMSVYLVFQNGGRPYLVGDNVNRNHYQKLISEALKGKKSGAQMMKCIKTVLEKRSILGREIGIMELLPQIITYYGTKEGMSLLRQQVPSLLRFYEDQVVTTILRVHEKCLEEQHQSEGEKL